MTRHVLLPLLCLFLAATLAGGCGDGRKARRAAPAAGDAPSEVITTTEGSGVMMVDGSSAAAAGAAGGSMADATDAAGAAAGLATARPGSDSEPDIDPMDLAILDDDDEKPMHTVAGLGDPSRPGLWMETPLVRTQQSARIQVSQSPRAAQVTLIPSGGPASGGSRLSLEAMTVLGVPLTELVELDVHAGG